MQRLPRLRNASNPLKRQGGCYLSDGVYPTHGAATERAPEGARRGDGAKRAGERASRSERSERSEQYEGATLRQKASGASSGTLKGGRGEAHPTAKIFFSNFDKHFFVFAECHCYFAHFAVKHPVKHSLSTR